MGGTSISRDGRGIFQFDCASHVDLNGTPEAGDRKTGRKT
ncbi:hypothetical protein FTUN_0020 [Frigoriglobus tundricola]|uniref:Uncharacterized protein n=1 Tax=Frigoriglobus tundricola TaxID=2774151 RepID=A0A6M5YFZ4_9BACT|nr:hypothetical protein FTUN_0020 [Frigoriglobus tundricola]